MSTTWSSQPAEHRSGERASKHQACPGRFATALECGAQMILDHAAKWDRADPGWADRDRIVVPGNAVEAVEEGLDRAPPQAGGALATAVGLALAERLLASRFGRSLVDHRSWAVIEPADLLSGLGHEAAGLAGALRLTRLAVLCIDAAPRDEAADASGRLTAQGWAVRCASAAEPGSLEAALSFAQRARKPTLIRLLASPGLGLVSGPDEARARRAAGQRRAWLRRLARHPRRETFLRGWRGGLEPPREAITALAQSLRDDPSASRVLAWLAALPELSCCAAGQDVTPRDGAGALACGLRVQGMAAALLGLNRHGGLIPCGIASLDAADLLRPALRACASSGERALAVLLDGDGACHDEHLAGLRAVPGLFVMRPADAGEAVVCLDRALRGGPAAYVVVLPRHFAASYTPGSGSAASCGGHLIAEPPGRRALTLVASGAELAVALAAREVLAGEGIGVAVVSLPCWEVFALQDEAYRVETLGTAPRIGIEAGGGFGWERWLGRGGQFAGASLEAVLSLARRLAR